MVACACLGVLARRDLDRERRARAEGDDRAAAEALVAPMAQGCRPRR